jgi:hypothetical protein
VSKIKKEGPRNDVVGIRLLYLNPGEIDIIEGRRTLVVA